MTINTLDDLIAYSETIADPEFWEPAVERPGLSADELAELERRFPDLPESYLRVLEEVRVLGRELGHFRLSPPADEDDDDEEPSFADALEHWNEAHVLADEMQERDLVEVAAASVHSLCVQRGGDGRILWLEERDEGEEPVVRDLAPSFGDLLLMAGRYDERRRAGADDGAPAEAIVDAIDDGIELNDEQRRSWADLIS
jgi:hypothetical protein